MTTTQNPVFEQTYDHYLGQIKDLPLADMANILGAIFESGGLTINLFGRPYRVSGEGIFGPQGEKPSFEICVILSKYLLLCPETPPRQKDWVTFKDFKDAAPLINYFGNDVERAMARHYTRQLKTLAAAGAALGGTTPDLEVNYDLALQFSALPKIPMAVLFNDADEDFPATCTVLFQRRTERHLDAECIAMLGWRLFKELKTVNR